MNRSTPDLPVHHQLPESTQTHVHRVGDAIQTSHPLSSPSPPAPLTQCKKAKRLSEEALQISEKRKDIKCKGEKERYIHLNAEFQRIQGEIRKPSSVINAKKDKNNRMEKTIDTKGIFDAKMGTIKDRNSMGLKKEEDIKKR